MHRSLGRGQFFSALFCLPTRQFGSDNSEQLERRQQIWGQNSDKLATCLGGFSLWEAKGKRRRSSKVASLALICVVQCRSVRPLVIRFLLLLLLLLPAWWLTSAFCYTIKAKLASATPMLPSQPIGSGAINCNPNSGLETKQIWAAGHVIKLYKQTSRWSVGTGFSLRLLIFNLAREPTTCVVALLLL